MGFLCRSFVILFRHKPSTTRPIPCASIILFVHILEDIGTNKPSLFFLNAYLHHLT